MTLIFVLTAIGWRDIGTMHRETAMYDAMSRRSGTHTRKGGRA